MDHSLGARMDFRLPDRPGRRCMFRSKRGRRCGRPRAAASVVCRRHRIVLRRIADEYLPPEVTELARPPSRFDRWPSWAIDGDTAPRRLPTVLCSQDYRTSEEWRLRIPALAERRQTDQERRRLERQRKLEELRRVGFLKRVVVPIPTSLADEDGHRSWISLPCWRFTRKYHLKGRSAQIPHGAFLVHQPWRNRRWQPWSRLPRVFPWSIAWPDDPERRLGVTEDEVRQLLVASGIACGDAAPLDPLYP